MPQPVSPVPQKKKSKAPLIILGIVGGIVALFILVGIIGLVLDSQEGSPSKQQRSSTATSSSAAGDKVELSKTYVNTNEGISFKYPDEWEKVAEADWGNYLEASDDILVLLVRIDEDDPALNSMLLVRKFDVPIEDAQEMFFSNETEFLELYSDVDIKETSVTKVDTVPAREIRYLDENGDGCQSYFYIAGAYTYKIEIYWPGEELGSRKQVFDAIMDSYTINAEELDITTNQTGAESAAQEYQDMVLYKDIPVDSLLAASYDEIIETFGEPDSSKLGGETITYGTTEMSFDMSSGNEPYLCIVESTTPGDFTYNGQALTTDQEGLTKIFGISPEDNGFGQWCYYWDLMGETVSLTVDPSVSSVRVSWWGTSSQETPEVKPALPYGYEWVEGPTATNENYPVIEGVIRNNTGTNMDITSIVFHLYDENGNLIGNASDSISDWQNGTTWKFSANCYAAFAYYEFASLNVVDF